jgi:hypothetical protein
MKALLLTVLVCCICSPMQALTEAPGDPFLRTGDVQGLVVTRTGHYDGNALFGYMDGGAELFREYGFAHLTAQEIRLDDQQLLVEIFRMRDSVAAFGIFSVSRAVCPGDDSSGRYWCHSSGEVQCAGGPFFIRIQSLTTGTGSEGLSEIVGRYLLRMIPDRLADVPWVCDEHAMPGWQRKAVLMYGPLGIQNGTPDWSDALEGGGYTSVTCVPWLLEGRPVTIGWIQCPSDKAAEGLLQRANGRGKSAWRFYRRCNGAAILVIDADFPHPRLEGLAETLLRK